MTNGTEIGRNYAETQAIRSNRKAIGAVLAVKQAEAALYRLHQSNPTPRNYRMMLAARELRRDAEALDPQRLTGASK